MRVSSTDEAEEFCMETCPDCLPTQTRLNDSVLMLTIIVRGATEFRIQQTNSTVMQ